MALLNHIARRLFLDRHAELWLGELDPVRSLSHIRARVLYVVQETADTRTFVLQPNRHWRGHRAGQFTMLEVEIDGVRVKRCYSISSPPGGRRLSITVKRVDGGRVSSWLHDHLRAGDVVGLSPAAGQFVLPEVRPRRLLLVSGGSGITPLMAILRDLAGRDVVEDVVLVHHARSTDDAIFRDDLTALAHRHPGLRVELVVGPFEEERLAALVPDFAARATFLCGPVGLMERVERMWAAAGATASLRLERFAPPPVARAGADHAVQVTLARSARTIVGTTGAATLLAQLEAAGERPPSGCRIGICHTCRCRKVSGAIQNLLTGEVSTAPDEDIQLCISVPRSDVELGL